MDFTQYKDKTKALIDTSEINELSPQVVHFWPLTRVMHMQWVMVRNQR